MFSFDSFFMFRKSFCVILRGPSEMLILLVNLSNGFGKFDFKFSKFFNFSALLSAIVQILRAKQNGMFRLQ